ncbi:MAG: YdcF family protein [Patescibacteria group bacterium]|nr:YdcF family protein [Patescibacteria group bacterium]
MNSQEVNDLAQKIWDYHHINDHLEKVQIIFVMCSHDLRVADYAVKLFLDGLAPLIVFSGGIAHKGDLVETPWFLPEAEVFAQRAVELGVPKEKIIIENKAQNCGENVKFTEKILEEKNINFDSVIAVQKPYMERRTYATIKLYWTNKKLVVTSPAISFVDYPNSQISKNDVINIMVGDLQRIEEYPKKSFQIFQEIPKDVWQAYEKLVSLGYTQHLMK